MVINSPSAWKTEEVMQCQDDWLYIFTDEEIAELISAMDNWIIDQRPIDELNKETFPLPLLSKKLSTIAEDLEYGRGFMMFRGLPVEDLGHEEAKVLFTGLGTHLGTPVAQSIQNEIVHDVYSKGEALTSEKGRGTQTCDYLPYHTDRADLVGLLCLHQGKAGGQSRIVSAISVYNEIAEKRPDLLNVLCQNFENIRAPWEPKIDGPTYRIPVFNIYQGHFACRYLRNFIFYAQKVEGVPALTDQQNEALDMVDALCDDPRFRLDIDFQPGDIQIINNFVTLHGRAEYEDYSQPHLRRHLLRLWLSSPLSRPLSPSFRPLYGNVSAGSLRGGMLAQPSDLSTETEPA